ncbi:hypothetical protein EUGRSUZ_C00733 [Eucalyptus grandis]|uniref:MTD1 n=2 Tax=Eucalyptus grandis TaxID=71139 RepID=A0A059CLQ3_EUCGR|nr:hypothetical protein EUGRSUZ_C00733 [Eucalyptus grandis]
MSRLLQDGRGVDEIEPPGFSIGAARPSIFDSPELDSTSASSSIGKNSDDDTGNRSSGGDDGEENEVQSSYKGPLEMMDALEEVLPMSRGISKFYDGKSKSFTSLADASASSSVKEIAKPENPLTRRRRNIFASSHMLDRGRNFPLRSYTAGITKRRPLTSSNSALVLKVNAMCSSESFSSASEDSSTSSASRSPPQLPPLHPRRRGSHNQIASPPQNSSWRSYSLADLQQCSSPPRPVLSDSMTEKADPEDLARDL